MDGFFGHIEKETLDNPNYRQVKYTGQFLQLVYMSLLPHEEIGEEIHENHDQFIRFESGDGIVILNDHKIYVTDGDAVIIPSGTKHNVINNSSELPLKLYTLYSPPEHPADTLQSTKSQT